MSLRRIIVETAGPALHEITGEIAGWLGVMGAPDGVVTLFVRHTSCSLLIQENADPDVRRDLMTAFDRLAPRNAGYVHATEGPDDMPAHIRTVLSGVALGIPVMEGQMVLGTWQGLYLVEHRDRPHQRDLVFHLIGA